MTVRLFFFAYRILWTILLPVMLAYIWLRGRRDPDYACHISERFGFYQNRQCTGAIWIHAVSLGETRSATKLIRTLLDRGETVLLTHFTPTGRRESARLFADHISSGNLHVVWVPFDMVWCHRRFHRAFKPRIGLTLEVEIWPSMIFTARAFRLPLYLCNGQYADKSFKRDTRGLQIRARIVRELAGAMVKSEMHAKRFKQIGMRDVRVTGELRFDQPIPETQVNAARLQLTKIEPERTIVTIASGVEDEEQLYCNLIIRMCAHAREHNTPPPLFIYVPRAPERFDFVADQLSRTGIKIKRRSEIFDEILRSDHSLEKTDVLLGDSLGEMFFYLALADRVVVGGGFTPRGAHNIIEPLMLRKPVIVGPFVWTIKYPFREAEHANIAISTPDADDLFSKLINPSAISTKNINQFLEQHGGASSRTLSEIEAILLSHKQDCSYL